MGDIQKNKVLVVQNHFASRNVIIYILRQNGFKHIRAARDGNDALNELARGEYGIVVSDWHMPGMDGLSLLSSIRENPALKELIFILVTAENDRDKVMEAKSHGVDGYLTKPFTAELLCRRIFDALRARCPDKFKAAQNKPAKPVSDVNKKPVTKIFGEAAGSGAPSPKSWSISLSRVGSKPQSVVKYDFAAMMNIMSLQFDMMKADTGFVSAKEMIEKVKSSIKNAELQAEHAELITKTANEINQALATAENVQGSSPGSMHGLKVVDKSAVKLADMIDSFDKEVADVIAMLNSMEHMVRQAHINEINESIKTSYALEMQQEAGVGVSRSEESQEVTGKVVDGLARIRFESLTARESLTTAAGGIAYVIEHSKSQGLAGYPSHELFQKLSGRIEHIMDMLDSQIALTEKLENGMKEVASVQKKIIEPDGPKETVTAGTVIAPGEVAETQRPAGQTLVDGASALKKIREYRTLMIDIVKKEHGLSMRDLEEMLSNNAGSLREHLPGAPDCSFSKWIDHSLTQKDYYDPALCQQIASYRDDMHSHALKAVELFRSGKKDEALETYQKVNVLSNRIEELLKELQDELRKKV